MTIITLIQLLNVLIFVHFATLIFALILNFIQPFKALINLFFE